jgi:hypothetical protein
MPLILLTLRNRNIAGLVDASIKVKFKIKSGRGAFLVMYRPMSIDLPKNVLLHELCGLEELKGMFLITSVFSCPAYSLCMTDSGELPPFRIYDGPFSWRLIGTASIQLAFIGNLPIPAAPGISAGGEVSARWFVNQTAGFYREGCDPQGNYTFKPLYQLKQMRKRLHDRLFRDLPGPERAGDDLFVFFFPNKIRKQFANTTIRCRWEDAEVPWQPLDDEGEEEEYTDDVDVSSCLLG